MLADYIITLSGSSSGIRNQAITRNTTPKLSTPATGVRNAHFLCLPILSQYIESFPSGAKNQNILI